MDLLATPRQFFFFFFFLFLHPEKPAIAAPEGDGVVSAHVLVFCVLFCFCVHVSISLCVGEMHLAFPSLQSKVCYPTKTKKKQKKKKWQEAFTGPSDSQQTTSLATTPQHTDSARLQSCSCKLSAGVGGVKADHPKTKTYRKTKPRNLVITSSVYG